MLGVRAGKPTPVPAVPDVVAVVYTHHAQGKPAPFPAPPGEFTVGEWEPSWSPAEHASAVESVRAAIARGDVYQVNFSQRIDGPWPGGPIELLRRVVERNPAPFGALAKDSMARSISVAFSTRAGTGSIPSDGAAALAACK